VRGDPWAPFAEAVAFAGARVVAIGSSASVRARAGRHVRVIDVGGGVVLPGLIDPHLHLFGLATRDAHLDLRDVRRACDVLARVAAHARALPPGRWVRAEGLDEQGLDRLPTAGELDAAAPRHPVRLRHRSRHASVLSGRGRAWLAARGAAVPDHGDGLVAGHDALISRTIGRLPAGVLAGGLARVGRELAALGVTTVGDATPRTRAGWTPLARLVRAGRFGQRVVAMRAPGTPPWSQRGRVVPGPVKLVIDEGPAGMVPTADEIASLVAETACAGDAVAIHCTGVATLVAALDAFGALAPRLRRLPHRLEHVGECPPAFVREIARLRLTVVTNPAFVYWRGDVYRRETPPRRHGWLYRARTLLRAGVPLAAGSDAPVVPVDPWRTMATARTRLTRAGRVLGAGERLGARAALALVTTAAGPARRAPPRRRPVPGAPADAVVVPDDPVHLAADRVAALRPTLTIIDGRIAWRR
jgi:predicted amidohydrolase YtcJ